MWGNGDRSLLIASGAAILSVAALGVISVTLLFFWPEGDFAPVTISSITLDRTEAKPGGELLVNGIVCNNGKDELDALIVTNFISANARIVSGPAVATTFPPGCYSSNQGSMPLILPESLEPNTWRLAGSIIAYKHEDGHVQVVPFTSPAFHVVEGSDGSGG